MPRPRTSMRTPETTNTRTLSQNPAATAGSASQPTWGSKNVSRVRGQPGAETTAATSAPPRTRVLVAATSSERTDCRRR